MQNVTQILSSFFVCLLGWGPMTTGQVILREQHFSPRDFTFDVVLENQGDQGAVLSEIGAEYRIFYYNLWMGMGYLPNLKSSADYELPIYLAPRCLESNYLKKTVTQTGRFGQQYGVWDCANYVSTDPQLLIKPGEPVRFRVKMTPEAFKAYWEMEVTLSLSLKLDNGTQVRSEPHTIFSEDIIAVLLPDLLLKEEKVRGFVNSTDPDTSEFIVLRGLGKLEYDFDRAVAVYQLDKIGLGRDSLRIWLDRLLDDPNARVRMAAAKTARKYQFADLVEKIVAAWLELPRLDANWNVYSELLFEMAHWGRYQYIDTLLQSDTDDAGNLEFSKLAAYQDTVFRDKLLAHFTKNKARLLNAPTSRDLDCVDYLVAYQSEVSVPLFSDMLRNSQNVPLVNKLLFALSGIETGEEGSYRFVRLFREHLLALFQFPGELDKSSLLRLVLACEEDPARIIDLLNQGITDSDDGVRETAYSLIAGQMKRDTFTRTADKRWQLIAALNEPVIRDFSIINPLLDEWIDPDWLAGAALPNLLTMGQILTHYYFNWTGPPSRLPDKRQQVVEALISPARLEQQAGIGDLFAYIDLFGTYTFDTIATSRTLVVLDRRLDTLSWVGVQESEAFAWISLLEQLANRRDQTPSKSVHYQQAAVNGWQYRLEKNREEQHRIRTAEAYNNLAWYQMLNREPKDAVASCQRGLALYDLPILHTNQPLALLLSGRITEARALYAKWRHTPYQGRTYREVFLEDLATMEEAGVIGPREAPRVAEIRQLLNQ